MKQVPYSGPKNISHQRKNLFAERPGDRDLRMFGINGVYNKFTYIVLYCCEASES